MRRVLVVAHAFPPCGGAGVQRTAKLVKCLPSEGWTPTVLTVAPSSYGVIDDSICPADSLSALDVVRSRCFDPVAQYTSRPTTVAASGPTPPEITRRVRSVARRMARAVWSFAEEHVLVPDRSVLWFPSALAAAATIQHDRPFDLVYATGEPYSSFLIGRRIARRYGVPYVLDMRDPWTQLSYRTAPRTAIRRAIERRLERKALEDCAACIFANDAIKTYREAFPRLANRFHQISNGYDPDDFKGLTPKTFDRFTIVHNGTFLPGYRTADTFLAALAECLRRNPELADRLQVLFVGKIGPESDTIRQLRLSQVVHQIGYVSHRESLKYLLGADALLLVGGRHRWEETGKVFEYLAAGKPIVALVEPDGAAAALIRDVPAARVVDRESVADAAAALENLATKPRMAVPNDPPPWLGQFERRRLSARVAAILDDSVAPAAASAERLRSASAAGGQ